MENLILVENVGGKAMTTSLKIAEIFGKEHNKVLRSVRENCDSFTAANFGLSEYIDASGKANVMYLLDRDFATFLIMGFTGEKAKEFKLKYIKAFNDMEAQIKGTLRIPQTFAEALRLAAEQQEQIEEQKRVLAIQAPKVEYHDEVLSAENGMTTTTIAKELNTSAKDLNKFLHDKGIQYKQGKQWVLYADYQKMNLMTTRTVTKECKDGSVLTFHDSLWTEEGRKFIHNLINNK